MRPKKWPEFVRRYHAELEANPEGLAKLKEIIGSHKTVTLLFTARDEERNNAVALQKFLRC